ncbi:MAG: ribosome biogenesis GTPase Der [Verrucomicrobiota bacterium]
MPTRTPDKSETTPVPAAGHLPTIAIVGRPNVGKSAVFNRIAGKRIAIVHDQPGVTRDRISVDCTRGKFPFTLVDTGGIGADADSDFTSQVQTEVDIAVAAADLIFFVVDAKDGLTPVDESVAASLRQAGTPTWLLVNKVDSDRNTHLDSDFAKLGFKESHTTSAAHGLGFPTLNTRIDEFIESLPPEARGEFSPEEEAAGIKIALVGRPNVGKSSLINAILDDQRTIVSDIAGTTRDAVDVPYTRDDIRYTLIDTAGIRPKNRRDSSVEAFSVMRSEKSIQRADLCLLVVDAARGVTAQDRKIARLILAAEKPCLVLANKFDLYHPDAKYHDRVAVLREDVGRELFFLHYAPLVGVSALKNQNVPKLFRAVQRVAKDANNPLNTGTLNRILHRAVTTNPPPAKGGKRLNLLYATQQKSDFPKHIPAPAYLLFVNHPKLLSQTYERYLENQLRDKHSYRGLPITFITKSRREGSPDRKAR